MNTHKKHTKSEQNQGLGKGVGQSSSQGDDDFFIPDLCNARSVLILVFASEMFALIVAVVA